MANALQLFHGPDHTGKDGPLEKLSFDLVFLYSEFLTYEAAQPPVPFQTTLPLLQLLETPTGPFVVIDAVATTTGSLLLTDLETLGLRHSATFGVMVSGQFPISSLDALAALSSLRFAEPALATTAVGAVMSQGDQAMRTAQVRTQFALNGAGITVGVLSDSYNCLGGAAADVASGDLPPDVMVLAEEVGCKSGSDEGRAMMQLISDVAPGSRLAFHTGFGGQANFAAGILKLADAAGVQIIVDDVYYQTEPMFQDGIIAQAVDQVVAAGVTYFSAAGNAGRQSYESAFVSSLPLLQLSPGFLHDFDPTPGVDPLLEVTIPVGTTAIFNLQWAQPYATATGGSGATSDLDLLLVGLSMSPVAMSMNKNIGRDPVEVLRYTNPGPSTTFSLAIPNLQGPAPGLIKLIYTGKGVTVNEYQTDSSTVFGHAGAFGALAVGAAPYYYAPAFGTPTPRLEPFSSAGPAQIRFDLADQPIVELRQKPELVAPDGANTTFFGRDIADPGNGSDTDTFPNFFGTSAAAPHAAAGAALLLEAKRLLPPNEVYALLRSTTIDMGQPGVDADSGYGLIQIDRAIKQLITPLPPTATPVATLTAIATPSPVAPTPTPPVGSSPGENNTPPTTPTPPGDAETTVQPDQPTTFDYRLPNGAGITVQIPAGAVNKPITLRYRLQTTPPQPLSSVFHLATYSFTLTAYQEEQALTGLTFQKPVSLDLTYTDDAIRGLDENQLLLVYYDVPTAQWSPAGITKLQHNLVDNQLKVQIMHLTEFALGTPTQFLYLPLVYQK